MWENMYYRKAGFGGAHWCILKDFNSTRSYSKRVGMGIHSSSFERSGCLEFSDFISQMKVISLPLLGRKFNWF